MILPSVAELLGGVGRHPAVERILDKLRRGGREARLAGLTETAKALIVAHCAAVLRRPVLLLLESNQQAEALTEPLRFFYRALSGQPASQVAILPALDTLPWQSLSPHPEILETRAVTLWRLASNQTVLGVAPMAAAQMRVRGGEVYCALGGPGARGEEVPLEEVVARPASVGYERRETVGEPGPI